MSMPVTHALRRYPSLLDLVEAAGAGGELAVVPSVGDDGFADGATAEPNTASSGARASGLLGPSVGDDDVYETAQFGPSVGDDLNQAPVWEAVGPTVGDDAAPA